MTAPLPCPFCGKPAEVWRSPMTEGWRVWCINTDCEIGPLSKTEFQTADEALAAWNTRKSDSNPPTDPKPGDTWGVYRFHEDGWWRLGNTRRGDSLLRRVWNHMYGQNMDGSITTN